MTWVLSAFLKPSSKPLIHKEACKFEAGQCESSTSSIIMAWEPGLSRAQ